MPYTTHGHRYGPPNPGEQLPQLIARCGGPGICVKCSTEATQFQAFDQDRRDRQARAELRLQDARARVIRAGARLLWSREEYGERATPGDSATLDFAEDNMDSAIAAYLAELETPEGS